MEPELPVAEGVAEGVGHAAWPRPTPATTATTWPTVARAMGRPLRLEDGAEGPAAPGWAAGHPR